MRSLPLTVFVAALALGAQAIAQDETTSIASTQFSTNQRGDSILSLSLGTAVPLGWYNPNTALFETANATPGFAFALSYAWFLNEDWALAVDLAGEYVGTVNDRQLFIAPLSLRAFRAFPVGPFLIAPTAGLGVAISALDSFKHVDPLFKAGTSVLWRASSDMSYTFNLYGNVIPQIFSDYPENSRVGFFMEATLAVAYHL